MSMRFKTVAAGVAMIALSGAAFAGGSSVPNQTGSAPSAQTVQGTVVTTALMTAPPSSTGGGGSSGVTGTLSGGAALPNLGQAIMSVYSDSPVRAGLSGPDGGLGGGFGEGLGGGGLGGGRGAAAAGG